MEDTGQEIQGVLDKMIMKRKRILDDKACEVCGDRSTGKHYGVFSCDGCSGFYKRTCRRSEPWHCKGHGDCPVDKSNRNDCKACRLKKCLEIGMNLEGVYRRSKHKNEEEPSPVDSPSRNLLIDSSSFAESQDFALVAVPQIRLGRTDPVSVKSEGEEKETAVPNKVPSPKYFTVNTEVVCSRVNSVPSTTRDQHTQARHPPHTTPLTGLSGSHVIGPVQAHLSVQTIAMGACSLPSTAPLTSPRFHPTAAFSPSQQNGHHPPPSRTSPSLPGVNGPRRTTPSLVSIRDVPWNLRPSQVSLSELHQAVEAFSFNTSEPLHEASTRLLSGSLRFSRRLPCFRRLPFRDQVILLEEGWREMLLLDAIFWVFPLFSGAPPQEENGQRIGQELKGLQESLAPLRTLKLNNSEYACLKAIVLFRTNTHGLKAADQIERLQDEAQLMLADYIRSRLPGQPVRFGRILLSVAALRCLAEKPFEHLFFNSVPAKDIFETILSQVISSN